MPSTEFKSTAVMEQVQMLDGLLLLSNSAKLRFSEFLKHHGRAKLSGGCKEPRIPGTDCEGFNWVLKFTTFSSASTWVWIEPCLGNHWQRHEHLWGALKTRDPDATIKIVIRHQNEEEAFLFFWLRFESGHSSTTLGIVTSMSGSWKARLNTSHHQQELKDPSPVIG